MNEIEISINPYDSITRININNRPISPYSELAKYLKEPFYTWCDKILGAISRELNDEFNITVISRWAEAYLLKGLAKDYKECIKFKHKNLIIDMPITDRFKKLSNIYKSNKIDLNGKVFPINIFVSNNFIDDVINNHFRKSNIFKEEQSNVFKVLDYPVCDINFNVKEYKKESFKDVTDDINFIIAKSNEDAKLIYEDIKNDNVFTFILVVNDDFGVYKFNNVFICEYENNGLINTLLELVELRWITPFYNNLLSNIKEKIHSDNIDSLIELKILSSSDYFLSVSFNKQMEVNTFAPLIIKSYPENVELPKLNFKFSKENIVSCDGKNILALAVGEVDVEVYIQGSLEPISKFHISVIQTNKIKKIELDKESYVMGIKDILKLSYKFWPENADNQSELKWTSTDTTVASVDENGNVVALNPGTCYIKISTEDISESCLISVKEKISNINISKQDINLYIGETTELNVEFSPKDVINNEILWETSDKNVAIFENGIIKATGIGKSIITFYTPDRSVSSSCNVSVKSTFEKKKYRNVSLTASVIVFILSIALSGINTINIVTPLIGIILGLIAIKHNKKDKGTAILFILLNLGMFAAIFFDLFKLY
ncbi:uncharacterized protein YjdB [Clostridium moniliforme]|uniref:Uncharacterized protein YjdB n=1 Tax=Clostridium moniliforme TaxID=39489 RepID=A0ABS4F280_9CLOT|nr:Ig-like domain-containing protein [Clostridium moniliforme]MBP1890370.1 uncharacterized protein YjdB [Clostridium moniliforme]